MQNWYRNVFVDATVPFELRYIQIWTASSNRDYTGFDPEILVFKEYVSVLREPPNKLTVYENT